MDGCRFRGVCDQSILPSHVRLAACNICEASQDDLSGMETCVKIPDLPDEPIDEQENDEKNPQRIEEVPVHGEQAQLEPFLGVGKIDEHRDGFLHLQAGGPDEKKYQAKREWRFRHIVRFSACW